MLLMRRYFDSQVEDFRNTRWVQANGLGGLGVVPRCVQQPIFSQAWKRFSAHAAERTADVKKRGCVNSCKKVWKQASQESWRGSWKKA